MGELMGKQCGLVEDLDQLSRAVETFRGHPQYIAPEALVRRALATGESDLLR